nr:hypothetical protein Itr_chr03CG06580 [Ipomoea trifida]
MRDCKCIFYFIVRFFTARLEVLFRRLLPCVRPWRVMSFFSFFISSIILHVFWVLLLCIRLC